MFTGAESLFVEAVYESNGVYQANYVLKKAGQYTVHVKLLGVDISGSPYMVTVSPGEVSASQSSTNVLQSDLAALRAG